MKTIGILFSLFISLSAFGQTNSLRLMTYNIRNGIGMDDVTDYDRTAKLINRINPDVVAIQEADSATARSKGKYVLDEIAERTAMKAYYAPAIPFDGGKYGIGLLSKETPLKWHYMSLPGREEKRTFLVAEFEDFVFCCTHFSLTPEDQLLSLPIIREEAAKHSKLVFVAGDLNAVSADKTIEDLETDFVILTDKNASTFPASDPVSCLDYIVTLKKSADKVEVINRKVVDDSITSDHRGVFIDIKR